MLLKTKPKESVLDLMLWYIPIRRLRQKHQELRAAGQRRGKEDTCKPTHSVDGDISAKEHQPPLYLKDLWLSPKVSISQYCLHMHLTTCLCYFSYTNVWSEARQFDLVYSIWLIRVDNIFISLNMCWYTFLCNTLISDNILKFSILFKSFHYLNLCLVVCCHWLKGYHVISNIFR